MLISLHDAPQSLLCHYTIDVWIRQQEFCLLKDSPVLLQKPKGHAYMGPGYEDLTN